MIKKILISSLLGLSLFMSGCGDTEGEDRLAIQQMLDDGNFAGVITELEGSAESNDDYIALGAAYMGKAGLTLVNILTSMAVDTESDSAFAGFVVSITQNASPTALSDLNSAIKNYQNVVNAACVNPNQVLTNSEKDICLYIGLASTGSAAVTIDLISGDVATFGDNTTNDDKLTASTCALSYSFDGNATGCTIAQDGNVTFTESGKTYQSIIVTVDGNTTQYGYLINENNQTVLTKNYCEATSFATRTTSDVYVNGLPKYYACPLNETTSSEELTTAGVLVDVLNNGVDSIGGSVADEETQADIDEFKCELLGGSYDGSLCTDTTDNSEINVSTPVSEADIIEYLNAQN